MVLEIDVDVGGLAALAADEPLEEHLHPCRIDRRDPQTEADRRIGCRSPPLTEDAAAAGKPHDVEHREKVGLVAQLRHQCQLVFEKPADLGGNAVWITLLCPHPRQTRQVFLWRAACWHDRIGVFVAQFVEREGAGGGPFHGALDGAGKRRKPGGECVAVVEVPFAVGKEAAAGLLDRAAVPHRGEGIEQREPAPHMAADVAGGHQRHPRPPCQMGKPFQDPCIVPLQSDLRQGTEPITKNLPPLLQRPAHHRPHHPPRLRRADRRQWHAGPQPGGMGGDLFPGEPALPGGCAAVIAER